MTSGALELCSNIPELLNVPIEVTFITRQMLFGHRTPRAAPGHAATEGAIRLFGLQTLAAPQVF
jgi:hypothetical protein